MLQRIKSQLSSPFARRALIHLALGALMGAYTTPGGYSPLGAAYFTGVWSDKQNYPAAFIGAVAGALLAGSYSSLFSLFLLSAFCMTWTLWQGAKGIKTRDKYLILTATQLFTVIAFHFDTTTACVFGLVSAAASVISALIVHNAMSACRSFFRRHIMPTSTRQAILCIFVGLLHLPLSRLAPFGMHLAVISACLTAFLASRSGGVFALGFVLCAAAGSASSFNTGTAATFMTILILSSFAASLAKPSGKWVTTPILAIALATLGMYISNLFSIAEIGAAASISLIIPDSAMRKLDALCFPHASGGLAQKQLDGVMSRLRTASVVLDSLSETIAGSKADSFFINRQLSAVREVLARTVENKEAAVKPRFTVTAGMAGTPKHIGSQTGDSCGVQECGNNVLVVLSDGCGTGAKAQAESTSVIDILSELISAGFGVIDALECANHMLIKQENGDMYATVDAILFNVNTGEAQMLKHGAPPSFIVRDTRIITICGEALPIGIVESAEPSVHSVHLQNGDRIVMVTDGITDALGSHLIATISETLNRASNPHDASQILLEAARSIATPDDMSAVFVFID